MESLRYKGRRPTHPGENLREDVLPYLKMSQAEFARKLGVSRQTVSELLREKRSLSPDMAFRVARLAGGTPSGWLKRQHVVDSWDIEHCSTKKYSGIKKLRSSIERKQDH